MSELAFARLDSFVVSVARNLPQAVAGTGKESKVRVGCVLGIGASVNVQNSPGPEM